MRKPIARLIALLAVCAVCAGAFSACKPPIPPEPDVFTVTVRYVDSGTGDEIAPPFELRVKAGDGYDVSARTQKEIESYERLSLEGEAVGTATEDVTVSVGYRRCSNEAFTLQIGYVDAVSGKSLSPRVTFQYSAGESYDVRELAELELIGYKRTKTVGAFEGVMKNDVHLAVCYESTRARENMSPAFSSYLSGNDVDTAWSAADELDGFGLGGLSNARPVSYLWNDYVYYSDKTVVFMGEEGLNMVFLPTPEWTVLFEYEDFAFEPGCAPDPREFVEFKPLSGTDFLLSYFTEGYRDLPIHSEDVGLEQRISRAGTAAVGWQTSAFVYYIYDARGNTLSYAGKQVGKRLFDDVSSSFDFDCVQQYVGEYFSGK